MNDDRLDREFRAKLKTLEDWYPREVDTPEVLWKGLSERRWRRYGARVFLNIAASIALLAVAGWFWLQRQPPTSAEAVATLREVVSDQENDAMAYVARLCKGDHVVCASEDFKTLESDLAVLTVSLNEVDREMARFGSDEHLLRARERIKDHQAQVIRAMVQML